MKKSNNAFTMIELVFVIVILGILAAVAIPKFAATRTDAQISKARADIASIRSAIVTERQSRLIQGESSWISGLSQNDTTLFDGNGTSELLMYGIAADAIDGHWSTTSAAAPFLNYRFRISSQTCDFTYAPLTGRFTLVTAPAQPDICTNLIN